MDDVLRSSERLLKALDSMFSWIAESSPEKVDLPGFVYVRERADKLRESIANEVDFVKALQDEATAGRLTDPTTSTGAADVARIRSGSQKHKLCQVYFAHPQGLTAEEAVKLAALDKKSSPWHRVSDLKAAMIVRPTGRTRRTEAGVDAEVLSMTLAAADKWREKYGDPAPPEIQSIFGDDVKVV